MRNKNIYMISINAMLILLAFARLAVSAEIALTEKELGVPLYSKMQFISLIELKYGIKASQYCSSSSPFIIKKYYRSVLTNIVELQEGGVGGTSYKLLLDIKSAANWMTSKKFINIFKETGKKECSTIVQIAIPQEILKDETNKTADKEQKPVVESKIKYFGLGGYVNTVNFSAGPSITIWPFEKIAFQASYGIGTFTSMEARGLYRFDFLEKIKPYLGAGYLYVEKDVTAIGVDTNIKKNSFAVFCGVELPVYKSLFAYIDASATPIKLETNITNGSRKAKVSVNYSPITVGIGLVYYIF